MITHILILALIVSASAAPQGAASSTTAETQTQSFKAIVQDQGNLNGHECTKKDGKCVEYKYDLCEFIRKSIKPIAVEYVGFCDVTIMSDRTEDNKLDVDVKLKLKAIKDELYFEENSQTFKAALNQVLTLLRNTPKLSVQLKDDSPAPPAKTGASLKDTYEYDVEGTLVYNGKPTKLTDDKLCAARSQIMNLNISSDLVNVMYMYGEKIVRKFTLAEKPAEENAEAASALTAKFTLIYRKSFFEKTGIDPTKDFQKNLQWGLGKPASTAGYTLETPKLKEADKPSADPAEEEKVDFAYTAVVLDNGALYGQTCNITEQKCPGYELKVCELAEKALVCGRLPSEGNVCTVEITNTTTNGTEVNVKLTMLSKPKNQYTVTKGCSTFGALYAQAYATYDPPKMLLQAPPAFYAEPTTEEELDKFLVEGTLLYKGKQIPSSGWNKENDAKVLATMKDYHTTDDVTQAFFRANRDIKDLKVDTTSGENVTVSFTMEYLTAYITKSQINPYCDLIEMMKWGFGHPDVGKDYGIDSDITITHTSPITTPPTTTIAPTTSPDGTDTEKEPETTTTTPDHGVNVKPSSFLCLLIVNLMYLLHHA